MHCIRFSYFQPICHAPWYYEIRTWYSPYERALHLLMSSFSRYCSIPFFSSPHSLSLSSRTHSLSSHVHRCRSLARALSLSLCVYMRLSMDALTLRMFWLHLMLNEIHTFSLNWAVNRDRNDLRRFIVDRHRCRVFIFVSTTVSFCRFIITRSIYISFRSYIFTYRFDLKSKHSFLFDTFCSFSFLRLSFDKQLKYSTLWTKLKLKQQQPKKSAAHTTRVNIQTKRNKTMKIEI